MEEEEFMDEEEYMGEEEFNESHDKLSRGETKSSNGSQDQDANHQRSSQKEDKNENHSDDHHLYDSSSNTRNRTVSPHQEIGMDDDDAHDKNSRNQTMSPQQRREMSEFDAYETKVTASNRVRLVSSRLKQSVSCRILSWIGSHHASAPILDY